MTHQNFCFWLLGILEASQGQSIAKEQAESILANLRLTFNQVEAKPAAKPEPTYLRYTGH
jgi:hypothetical protein